MADQIPFNTRNLVADGEWNAARIPDNIIEWRLQARTAADIQLSSTGNYSKYYTIKSGDVLSLHCANVKNQTVYLRATAGVVLEVIEINRP